MNLELQIFQALLKLYPQAFRQEYGKEMTRVFQESLSSQGSSFRFWARTFWDVISSAGRERGGKTMLGNRYTDSAMLTFHFTRTEAFRLGQVEIGPEHLLLGLLRQECQAVNILTRSGATLEEIRGRIEAGLKTGTLLSAKQVPRIAPRALSIMNRAAKEAQMLGSNRVDTPHILLAIALEENSAVARTINELIPSDQLRTELNQRGESS
jgi:xanthine/CO dehydrogenase XdhC/CoxF family maturation factor